MRWHWWLFIGTIGLWLVVACWPARAEPCPCGGYRVSNGWDVRLRCYRCPGRVYGWRSDDDDDRHWTACRDVRRAVGDQHLTVDGAKKAANDAWAATIRFHLGEKWMDLANARHVVYTCSRSSIKEQGASVTTAFQALTRCEISAQPCEAPRQQDMDPR